MSGFSDNMYNLIKQKITGSGANPSVVAAAVEDYLIAHPVTIDSLDATKVNTDTSRRFISDANLNKLAGIAAGAEVNVNADWNSATGDSQILNKPTLAPADAQKNSDITKAEIEAKLTGEISSHSHAGGSGLTLPQTLAKNFVGC